MDHDILAIRGNSDIIAMVSPRYRACFAGRKKIHRKNERPGNHYGLLPSRSRGLFGPYCQHNRIVIGEYFLREMSLPMKLLGLNLTAFSLHLRDTPIDVCLFSILKSGMP